MPTPNRQTPQADLPLVVAITGASGAVYAMRLLEVLIEAGREVCLTISPSGAAVVKQELGRTVHVEQFDLRSLLGSAVTEKAAAQVHYYHYTDFMAPLARGSHLTGGMVVCPSSGS